MTPQSHARVDCKVSAEHRKIVVKNTFVLALDDSDDEQASSVMGHSSSEGSLFSRSSQSSYLAFGRVGSEVSCSSDAWQSTNSWVSCHDIKVLKFAEEAGMEDALHVVQNLEDEGLLDKIPRNENGDLTSAGSIKHASGQCVPCIFWFRGQCRKKLNCTHCHFIHPGQKPKRHKPTNRARHLIRVNKEMLEQLQGTLSYSADSPGD
eukprot:CAMPEP_0197627010 /NCGR_PEP_ID=MMETSP1338-20131121/5745_1 /TAXON_ID=43686 ORGANISM="Pelagodinium beii, Strain RCC1491" /NCGR_SAMPLE_ID=MMETSP1338 /ASSEMBLY_ACC=CAM_ASM_000754 /LENGTH=205 /DNA_ID=CAMNT_0043197619 /DNA_START=55 /DNA_END=672 /DNA_ORIENTATION=-